MTDGDDLPGSAEPGGDDSWADIELNDSFVAGARRSEASADERVAKAQRVNAEHAALEREGAISPYASLRKPRFGWFRKRAAWLVPLLILVLLAAALVAAPAISRWIGATMSPPGWPQPGQGEHASRLHPAVAAADSTSFTFQHLQLDGTAPVTYDPCRVIHYVINPRNAPAGGNALVRQAFMRLQHATGLQFTYQGTTAEKFSTQRPPYQPWLYGDRWAPVLVTWTQPSRDRLLAGDVIGDAGSAWVSVGDGSRYYVTGQVSLDGPQLGSLMPTKGGKAIVRAVILHELGHLVGLSHTQDPTQIMFPHASGAVTDYAKGDLAGLAALGRGTCSTAF